jgi:predicted nucleotidyltransferase
MDINYNCIWTKSNQKWLEKNTIFLTKYGSHAYGTSRPDSDLDIRGVCVEPKQYYYGVLDNFEQFITSEPYDITIFGIKKFIKLAVDNNPNAMEIMFTDESDHIFINDIGKKLLDIKDLFLSKKSRFTLAGYARSQLRRIKTHREWILNPPRKKPVRQDFGLPEMGKLIPQHQLLEIEAAIRKVIDDWTIDTTGMDNDAAIKFKNELYDVLLNLKINHDDMDLYAARYLGLNDNLVESFKKERAYKIAAHQYEQYEEWKEKRNKSRYELEEKFHYDTKHGMHLVRLYRSCEELLKTGKLNVKRADAEELLSIRNGAWTYDELIEWADKQDKLIDELYKTSTLRKEPERVKINEWMISTISEYHSKEINE